MLQPQRRKTGRILLGLGLGLRVRVRVKLIGLGIAAAAPQDERGPVVYIVSVFVLVKTEKDYS